MNSYKMPVRFLDGVPFRTSVLVSMALVCTVVSSVRPAATQGYATERSVIGRQASPMVTLQTSENPIDTGGPTSALVSSPNDDEIVYIVNGMTGEVGAYQGGPAPSYGSFAHTVGPFAIRSRDSIAYIDSSSKVVIAEPNGRILLRIDTPPAISLATLRNGNIVVASPTEKHFLHLYTATGRLLRSFGDLRNDKKNEEAEVRFLHRGKLLVDASDNIYYIYHFLPLVQVFSPNGELKREIDVQGEAVGLQQEVAQQFFSLRKPNLIGGIGIINSGAIDWKTGHLWLGMNGSSITGTVYEYDTNGEKLAEYALQVGGPTTAPYVIIDVKDLAITRSKLYVVTRESQVFGFARSTNSTTSSTQRTGTIKRVAYLIKPVAFMPPGAGPALRVPACGTAQTWAACEFNCPGPACNGNTPTTTSSDSAALDCKDELMNSLSPGYTVIAALCTQYVVGTAMHVRGGCRDDVTICRNGVNSNHNVTLDCSPPDCPIGGGGGGGPYCIPCLDGGTDPITCECNTPILIDTQGDGFDLTDAAGGVNFDLDFDGLAEHLSWTSAGSDEAFLALDRNGNGSIDNGTELFGNFTPQPPSARPNGFRALAEFDKSEKGGNGDGVIDRRDAVFSSLRLWQDENHNGLSETSELHPLGFFGVDWIALDYSISRRRDQHGNWFRYRARVKDTRQAHVGRWAWDVILVSQ